MAGSEGWGRIVYAKDERGVILDSQVVPAGEETPEGFEDSAEYESVVISPTEGPPVAESRLTTWDGVVLGQTVDVIKGDEQEGPSQPGGPDVDSEDSVEQGGEVVVDGDPAPDAGQTVDEVKDEADQQEGPSDPGGDSESVEVPPQGGPGSGAPAWRQYAASQGVSVSEDASRDEIIAALKAAGKPVS
jgi:hypothetical protein